MVADSEKLWYPGLYGIPFRGKAPPNLKTKEAEENLNIDIKFDCADFDLSLPADRDRYREIRSKIANKEYVGLHIEWHRDAASGKIRVYLEWGERAWRYKGQPLDPIVEDGPNITRRRVQIEDL